MYAPVNPSFTIQKWDLVLTIFYSFKFTYIHRIMLYGTGFDKKKKLKAYKSSPENGVKGGQHYKGMFS